MALRSLEMVLREQAVGGLAQKPRSFRGAGVSPRTGIEKQAPRLHLDSGSGANAPSRNDEEIIFEHAARRSLLPPLLRGRVGEGVSCKTESASVILRCAPQARHHKSAIADLCILESNVG